jgi:RNA polymerase sigma factor (sigma-70 family)
MKPVASLLRFVPAAESRTDGELLSAFRSDRDEPAFAELVRRHGPMVWGVCRRHLPDHADAEDAFQAAFLVLVRRAKGLTNRATLGPWLYRVAAWTARNLRRKNARRLARQSALPDTASAPPTAPDNRLDIDAALLALPERYRDPIVLCHLEGLSRRDAAERLGCPEGTLSSLLSRGLTKLRSRLAGHEVIVAVPVLLAASTVRAASATQVAVSASVAQLMEGVLRMFWVKKATAATAALVVVFGFGVGVGLSGRTGAVAAGEGFAEAKATVPALEKAEGNLRHHEGLLKNLGDSRKAMAENLRRPGTATQMAELTALRQQFKSVDGAFSHQQRLTLEAKAAVVDLKLGSLPAPPNELNFTRYHLRLATERRDHAAVAVKVAEDRAAAPESNAAESRAALERARAELRAANYHRDDALQRVVELEHRPTASALVITALADPSGQWRVTEYGPDGRMIGSLTADIGEALTLSVTRAAKAAPPAEVRVYVRDDAGPYGAYVAVGAAKAAGFAKIKFSGAVPAKATHPADLPRHHLEEFETEKLHKQLTGAMMGC